MVAEDGLTVEYVVDASVLSPSKPAVVKTSTPIRRIGDETLFYFEITVLDQGLKGYSYPAQTPKSRTLTNLIYLCLILFFLTIYQVHSGGSHRRQLSAQQAASAHPPLLSLSLGLILAVGTVVLTDVVCSSLPFNCCQGWVKHSYGYHGDDGMAYHNQGSGTY